MAISFTYHGQQRARESNGAVRYDERYAAMVAAFGTAKVFDARAALQSLGNGGTDDNNDIAAGLIPRSTLYDSTNGQVHLSLTAMNAFAALVHASGKVPV